MSKKVVLNVVFLHHDIFRDQIHYLVIANLGKKFSTRVKKPTPFQKSPQVLEKSTPTFFDRKAQTIKVLSWSNKHCFRHMTKNEDNYVIPVLERKKQ